MGQFNYKAIASGGAAGGSGGAGRLISGRVESPNEASLRDRLKSQGLIALEVRPVNAIAPIVERLKGDRLRASDAAWFFQTLHRLIAAKMPIESAVATIEDLAPRPRLREAAADVRTALRGGDSIADAAEKVPGLATPETAALLRVGMASGQLEHTIELIDRSMQTRQRTRKTIAQRLAYPAILFIASFLAVWFLASFVIPRFAETLETVGAELPASTRFTLTASRYAIWGVPLLFVVVVLIGAARPWRRVPGLTEAIDARLLRAPVVGKLIWHGQSMLVTDTLATVIEGGGEVLDGLEHASRAIASPTLRARLDEARRGVREGRDLGAALSEAEVLPPMPAAFVRVGMKSGNLVDSLRAAVDVSVEQQEQIMGKLLTLLEPAIILMLAGLVAWIVYSLVSGMLAVNDLGAI